MWPRRPSKILLTFTGYASIACAIASGAVCKESSSKDAGARSPVLARPSPSILLYSHHSMLQLGIVSICLQSKIRCSRLPARRLFLEYFCSCHVHAATDGSLTGSTTVYVWTNLPLCDLSSTQDDGRCQHCSRSFRRYMQ